MKIELCVSVPDDGENMLALLAQSAAATASGEHEVALRCTYHGDEQKKKIEQAGLALPIAGLHRVEREPNAYLHANSVTHSRCVNTLFAESAADIAVICDYDGAILCQDWDRELVDILVTRRQALFGAPYPSNLAYPVRVGANDVPCLKYQNLPNCIFMAYQPARLKPLAERLCDFADTYATPDGVPVLFISSRRQSTQYGLPIGMFMSIDTGSRVPQLAQEHQLPAEVMERKGSDYRVLGFRLPPGRTEGNVSPEEYIWRGKPFFVHYRKGSTKASRPEYQWGYAQADFVRDVRSYLKLPA